MKKRGRSGRKQESWKWKSGGVRILPEPVQAERRYPVPEVLKVKPGAQARSGSVLARRFRLGTKAP